MTGEHVIQEMSVVHRFNRKRRSVLAGRGADCYNLVFLLMT